MCGGLLLGRSMKNFRLGRIASFVDFVPRADGIELNLSFYSSEIGFQELRYRMGGHRFPLSAEAKPPFSPFSLLLPARLHILAHTTHAVLDSLFGPSRVFDVIPCYIEEQWFDGYGF